MGGVLRVGIDLSLASASLAGAAPQQLRPQLCIESA